jgi:peptidoglycan/LPS O-acetylase OafA/YrhL
VKLPDPKSARNEKWVSGVDSLRFVLAMIVFLSHLDNAIAAYLKSFPHVLLRLAGIGVNHAWLGPGAVIGFFVISGFVIHYPLIGTELNAKPFLVRRWVRVGIPLLVVAIASSFIDRFDLIPIWSLYCELVYYTIYPLLRRLKISWTTQFLVAFVISLAVIGILARGEINSMFAQQNLGYTGSYAVLGNMLTWIVGLPCWLLGVLVAERAHRGTQYVSRLKVWMIRLVVWAIAVVLVGLKAHWFVSYLLTLNFFAFLIAWWFEKEVFFFRDHAAPRWLEFCGKFSYSLFLLHGISVSVVVLFMDVTIATYFLYVLITLLISYVFYLLVEKPALILAKRLGRAVAS